METEEYVREWLAKERGYTLEKFGLDADREHIREWYLKGVKGWWEQQFDNYLGRAQVLGLGTPAGRQALAKFAATAVGMLEAAVREFGPLPKPGVPSGENLDKLGEL